jgi:hypothetical protein
MPSSSPAVARITSTAGDDGALALPVRGARPSSTFATWSTRHRVITTDDDNSDM